MAFIDGAGAVQLFDDAAAIPLPAMIVNAVQAVLDASEYLNNSFLDAQEAWVANGSPPPAPVQYAITRAAITLKVSLSFDLTQQEEFTRASQASLTAEVGGRAGLVKFKAKGSYSTSTTIKRTNTFNLKGEMVTTIEIDIAPVYAPSASGT